MMRCETEASQIVAVLNDVNEGSDATPATLRHLGFSEEVVWALSCPTKQKGEDYFAFISRAMSNPLARRVKQLDLIDNMDSSRLTEASDTDVARMRKYAAALTQLRGYQGGPVAPVYNLAARKLGRITFSFENSGLAPVGEAC